MTTFINSDYQSRVWPDLTAADGVHTLALDSQETADLDLSPEFEDTYLKPVLAAKASKPADAPKNLGDAPKNLDSGTASVPATEIAKEQQ